MKPVSDPAILEQLNGARKAVTDPNLLAQLNGEPPKEPGLFDRIGSDLQKRHERSQQYNQSGSGIENKIKDALNVGGFVTGDVPGRVIESGWKSLPDQLTKPVEQGVGNAVTAVANFTPPGGNAPIKDVFQGLGQEYNKFEQADPLNASRVRAVGDLGNILAAFTPVKGTSAAGAVMDTASDVAKTGSKVVGNVLDKADTALGKTILPSASDLKKASQNSFSLAKNTGGVLPVDKADEFVDFAQQILPQDAKNSAAFGMTEAQKIAKGLDSYKGQNLSFDEAMALDKSLGNFIDGPGSNAVGGYNPDGYSAIQMRNKLRETLENFPGNDSYRQAMKDWGAQAQTNDIMRVIEKSSYADNPATVLKNGFKAIAQNPSRLSSFPKNVQGAIKSAAKGDGLSNFLRTEVGSRLLSTITGAAGGASGGPLGALAGAGAGLGISSAARGGAEVLQMGKANRVLSEIAANSSLKPKKLKRSEVLAEALKQRP